MSGEPSTTPSPRFSAAALSPATPLTIATTMDRVVRSYPDEEALVDRSGRLTYRELDDAVRRHVSLLRAEGVVPGTPVALMTLASAMHLVSWLAVVRLGALPLVLHTRESDDVLATICDRFSISLLIHDASLETRASSIAAKLPVAPRRVRVRSAAEPQARTTVAGVSDAQLERHPPATDLPVPREDDPAVIILSSGTTSLPKGVVHSHRNLIEAARSAVAMFGDTGPGARSIVAYSTAFTGCYITWLPMLHAGGCCVFLDRFDLEEFAQTIVSERISHVSLTPTMWRKLLALNSDAAAYKCVRLAIFAAEPMDSTTLERIRAIVTPNVAQGYGSTETLGLATHISAHEMIGERLLSVGRPFPTTEVRLMPSGQSGGPPVAVGELGEVWVNAPSVAVGIWGNPEIEAKVLCSDGERRWWRSGDLGRFDSGGYLFLEGRHDDMIISGGINIMPATVEEAIMKHPDVREVAVVGIKHPEWGEQPHAFVVRSGVSLDERALDEFLRNSSLSNYQRPRAYHFVDSLPYTATNKLNRRVLRERYSVSQDETR